MKIRAGASWFVALAVLVTVAGCGADDGLKLYPLTGKIMVSGQAPVNYNVYLVAMDEGGTDATLAVDQDGSYVARSGPQGRPGAVAGKYKLVLEALGMMGPPSEGGTEGGMAPTAPGGIPGMGTLSAELKAYGDKETSPKEITVEAGTNTLDITVP